LAVSKSNKKMMFYSALVLMVLFTYALVRDVSQPVTLSFAKDLISKEQIKKAIIVEETIYLYAKQGTYRLPLSILDVKSIENLVVDTKGRSTFVYYFLFVFLTLLIVGVSFYLYVKSDKIEGGFRQSSKNIDDESSAIVATTSDILFRDVAGIEDVKEELFEVISFLKDPNKFAKFGVRMPRGLLLVGPPGVGKTMIAKAVAGEAGVPFYYQSASSFVQIYVGMGAKRVRELFAEAKKNAPSIVFIDEIDAVGKMRGASGRNDERDATLNQLLTEMDGFDSDSGVVVVAATNKIDVLDDALLRAGRFDRRIFVELPTLQEREAIVSKYIEKIPNNIDVQKVAQLSVGFNGASIATLINEAALKALRDDSILVNMGHIEAVKDKVKDGKKRLELFSDEQKEQQAHYQVAKAMVARACHVEFERCTLSGDDITVNRSSQASKNDLLCELKVYLSGMAMMHIVYGEHFTSAEKDLAKARLLCRDMVGRFGMGDEITGDTHDEHRLLKSTIDEIKNYLQKNETDIRKLASKLLEDEILSFDDFSEKA
jgi:cell division protease FtsH